MSHSYYYYETEEQRQHRLMMERITRIKNELRASRDYIKNKKEMLDSKKTSIDTVNVVNEVNIADYINENDMIHSNSIITESNKDKFISNGKKRESLDLSDYLLSNLMIKDDELIRLQSILSRIDYRIIDSEKGRNELNRLKYNLNEIMRNKSYDIEDIISLVEQRITIFLENENYDNTESDEDLIYDYKALCILLGREEQPVEISNLKTVVNEMINEYLCSSKKVCIADALKESFECIGYNIDEFCKLDGDIEGEVYTNNNDSDVKLFVSYSNNGIMIEPIIKNKNESQSDRENAQKRGCESQKRMIEELSKRGIILKKSYSEELDVNEIASSDDLHNKIELDGKKDDKYEAARKRNRIIRNNERLGEMNE